MRPQSHGTHTGKKAAKPDKSKTCGKCGSCKDKEPDDNEKTAKNKNRCEELVRNQPKDKQRDAKLLQTGQRGAEERTTTQSRNIADEKQKDANCHKTGQRGAEQ